MRALLIAFALAASPAGAQVLHNGGVGFTSTNPTGTLAANATAINNAACTVLGPLYIEIDNASGPLYSISIGGYTADTANPIASASKRAYAQFVAQVRAGAPNSTDISALTFSDGNNGMGSYTKGKTCQFPDQATGPSPTGNICIIPPSPPGTPQPSAGGDPLNGANTIAYCNTLCISQNMYSAPNGGKQLLGSLYTTNYPATTGTFDYDSAHHEVHALSQFGTSGPQYGGYYFAHQPTATLAAALLSEMGVTLPGGSTLTYGEPLLAGGIQASASGYLAYMRPVLTGAATFKTWLGTNQVCAQSGGCSSPCLPATQCAVSFSPISYYWHYSLGHWVESDPTMHNDFSYSSPGAFGFYPWYQQMCPSAGHQGGFCHSYTEAAAATNSNVPYAGVLARYATPNGATGRGTDSQLCGQLVRYAFFSGVPQTGTTPNWQF